MSMLVLEAFIAVIVSWVLAQFLKVVSHYARTKKWNWSLFIQEAGFPSSHSSTVASITMFVFLAGGLSMLFMVSLVFSGIVVRDALGLRRRAGQHAKLLNILIKNGNIQFHRLNELMGHSPLQVIGGVVLGAAVATGIYFI